MWPRKARDRIARGVNLSWLGASLVVKRRLGIDYWASPARCRSRLLHIRCQTSSARTPDLIAGTELLIATVCQHREAVRRTAATSGR
jgi:hypothetical protein